MPQKPTKSQIADILSAERSRLGKLGGAARAVALSAKKRREIAAKAGSSLSFEQASARAKKTWETRRKNKSKIVLDRQE